MLTLFVVELWAFVSTTTETQIVVDQYVEPQVSFTLCIVVAAANVGERRRGVECAHFVSCAV
jgi:hypothetical protein